MTSPDAKVAVRTTLVDIGNCIGCRACQVACKQWNERDGEITEFEPDLGFQNPAVLSANTYTLNALNMGAQQLSIVRGANATGTAGVIRPRG